MVNILILFVALSKMLNVKNNRRGLCFYKHFFTKKDPISDILSIELFAGRQVRAPFLMINGPHFTECHLNFAQKCPSKKPIQYLVLCDARILF